MNILASTCSEFAGQLAQRHGIKRCHAQSFYRSIFQSGSLDRAAIPARARPPATSAERAAAELRLPPISIGRRLSAGGITKFVSSPPDGERFETVVIRAERRTTLCVSSQVGCRMACRFCATGLMGFRRNLAVEEITWQVYAARFALGHRIDNVVFMGMGEPMDNLDSVIKAIKVISDQRGFDIACRHITVSTAGHADGILALAAAGLPNLRLAVSLNSADDDRRSRLMPINRTWPLKRLKAALRKAVRSMRGIIFIEYVLIAGENDSAADAERLADYLDGLPARINLIACNPVSSPGFEAPSRAGVLRFAERLSARRLFVRIRPERGRSIMAGCGQLGAERG